MDFDLTNTLPIGTRLCSAKYTYTITAVLGRGGFGITYRAEVPMRVENITVKASFCIKEFFPKMGGERASDGSTMIITSSMRETIDSCLRDFRSEARRLRSLSGSHPNIVNVNEVFDANGTSYYVMEYLEGESLKSYIERCGPLSQDEMLNLLEPIVEAVAFLHERNFTHLDIKPANIMLATDPERPGVRRPVLIDFGLSKHYDEDGMPTSTLNQSGVSHGYSPREQYTGIKTFSPWADVYALGATMLTCLTGEVPPSSTELNDEDLPRLLPTNLTPALRSALLTALALNRTKRFQSARTLHNALPVKQAHFNEEETQIVDNNTQTIPVYRSFNRQPIVTKDDKPQEKPKEPTGDNYIKVIGTLVVLAVIATVAFFFYLNHKPDIEEEREQEFSMYDQEENKKDVRMVEGPSGSQVWTIDGISFTMIPVEGGTFTMGATAEQDSDYENEKPPHSVTLSTFLIGQTEVTQALWQAVMGNNPSSHKGDNYPVDNVSWDDCQKFIAKLNYMTGKKFRLPTEAEWEYAARGGNRSRGYRYSGSNDDDSVAWHYFNCDKQTQPVATKSPNELGLYDMSGNVYEWCQDWFGKYPSYPLFDPKGPSSGSDRIMRGGSARVYAGPSRVSYRLYASPDYSTEHYGFRLCL